MLILPDSKKTSITVPLSLTLKNVFSDHFLTCGNPGTGKHQYNKVLQLALLNV